MLVNYLLHTYLWQDCRTTDAPLEMWKDVDLLLTFVSNHVSNSLFGCNSRILGINKQGSFSVCHKTPVSDELEQAFHRSTPSLLLRNLRWQSCPTWAVDKEFRNTHCNKRDIELDRNKSINTNTRIMKKNSPATSLAKIPCSDLPRGVYTRTLVPSFVCPSTWSNSPTTKATK